MFPHLRQKAAHYSPDSFGLEATRVALVAHGTVNSTSLLKMKCRSEGQGPFRKVIVIYLERERQNFRRVFLFSPVASNPDRASRSGLAGFPASPPSSAPSIDTYS